MELTSKTSFLNLKWPFQRKGQEAEMVPSALMEEFCQELDAAVKEFPHSEYGFKCKKGRVAVEVVLVNTFAHASSFFITREDIQTFKSWAACIKNDDTDIENDFY